MVVCSVLFQHQEESITDSLRAQRGADLHLTAGQTQFSVNGCLTRTQSVRAQSWCRETRQRRHTHTHTLTQGFFDTQWVLSRPWHTHQPPVKTEKGLQPFWLLSLCLFYSLFCLSFCVSVRLPCFLENTVWVSTLFTPHKRSSSHCQLLSRSDWRLTAYCFLCTKIPCCPVLSQHVMCSGTNRETGSAPLAKHGLTWFMEDTGVRTHRDVELCNARPVFYSHNMLS